MSPEDDLPAASCTTETRGEEVHFFVNAPGDDPQTLWRNALNCLATALRTRQIHPSGLFMLECLSTHPARFHPGIKAMDLIRREVFGGFDLHLSLKASTHPLVLHAAAKSPRHGEDPVTWKHYRQSELEAQMSPRSGAPSMEAVFRDKRENSQHFRDTHPHAAYDIAYGPCADETFDLFYPDRRTTSSTPPPLWVFIHGGYWQASDKRDVHDLGTRMIEAGYAVAMVNYGLCPQTPLRQIVDQVRHSLQFIHGHAEGLGVDAQALHIAGTSAGGHLAAMMASDPALGFLRSALIISGIHDLEPVALIRTGALLGLDAASIKALSPLRRQPNPGVRLGMAVGELESHEFQRMSRELALQWQAPLLVVEGKSHFNVTDHLANGGALLELALTLCHGDSPTPSAPA